MSPHRPSPACRIATPALLALTLALCAIPRVAMAQAGLRPPSPADASAAGPSVVLVPATPRQAVEGFYRALGRGDGIEAATYLIPEKRGRGPFSAAAMQRFYSGLARPLAVRSIEPLGPETLRVRYGFVTRGGGICDGESVVSVRPSETGALIEGIRAISGC